MGVITTSIVGDLSHHRPFIPPAINDRRQALFSPCTTTDVCASLLIQLGMLRHVALEKLRESHDQKASTEARLGDGDDLSASVAEDDKVTGNRFSRVHVCEESGVQRINPACQLHPFRL